MNIIEDKYSVWQKRFSLSGFENKSDELAFVQVPIDQTVAFITTVRDIDGYKHLVFFTVVDLLEDGVFRLTYMLHNYDTKHDLGIQTDISRDAASMESIHHLWPHGKTYQRELKEMFGIDFPGSPGVDESFVLEGWFEMPPMRRDFDTKEYSEATYFPRPGRKTFDTQEYMKEKLYPSEAETW